MSRLFSRFTLRFTPWAAMLLLAAATFAAEPPTARPASTPSLTSPPLTTQPSAENISHWLDDLADADSAVRDAARENLLGISRGQLGILRELVQQRSPLDPAQSAALRDIVVHVYLAEDPYPKNLRAGFLGVMLGTLRQGVIAPDLPVFEPGASNGAGVIIKECMPGFCGFRFLRPGDVVLGVGREGGGVVGGPVAGAVGGAVAGAADGMVGGAIVGGPGAGGMARTPSQLELISAVSSSRPGQTLIFHLLRQGRMIDIPIRLDARPRAADINIPADDFQLLRPAPLDEAEPQQQPNVPELNVPPNVQMNNLGGQMSVKLATEELHANRRSKAEAYWRAAFAILLDEPLI